MKRIFTVIPTNLDTNLLLFFFHPFVEFKNKVQMFSRLLVWKRDIILLFVYSESCSTSMVCQIQLTLINEFFLHVIPVRIIVPW